MDVRDVALAHLRAAELPHASGWNIHYLHGLTLRTWSSISFDDRIARWPVGTTTMRAAGLKGTFLLCYMMAPGGLAQVMMHSAPSTWPHCCAVCAAGRHLLTASKTAVSPKQVVRIMRVRS